MFTPVRPIRRNTSIYMRMSVAFGRWVFCFCLLIKCNIVTTLWCYKIGKHFDSVTVCVFVRMRVPNMFVFAKCNARRRTQWRLSTQV